MRDVLHILIALTVVWCGLHVDDPAQAAEATEQHHLLLHDEPQGGDEDQGGASKAAHAGHHHCPVAPDVASGQAPCDPAAGEALISRRDPLSLKSRSHAPPLQPPAA